MGIIGGVLKRARVVDGGTSQSPSGWMTNLFGGGDVSENALKINEYTALSLSVVRACINVISEDVAKLPLVLYKRAGGGKERAPEHPLYNLLHSSPNKEMASVNFRQDLTAHMLGWGNGYAEIERLKNGRPGAVWPMHPSRTRLDRTRDGELVYIFDGDDRSRRVTLPAEDVIHVRGLGPDGLVGYSVIRQARETMGLAWAAERSGSSFFAHGAHAGGFLEHPGKLSDPAYKRLLDSWNAKHRGPEKVGGVDILEENMTFRSATIPNKDAQFLEIRQFQVEEICRWYRVPPHIIQHLARSTNNNIEHQGREYVTYTLMGWLVRWEQELNRKLFPDGGAEYFAEHVVDALLRGDTTSRYNAHKIGREGGWLSADEIREKENMNPLPDGQGKMYLVPANMTTPEKLAEEDPPKTDPDPSADPPAPAPEAGKKEEDDRSQARSLLRGEWLVAARVATPLLRSAYSVLLRREQDRIRSAAKGKDVAAAADAFYADHRDHAKGVLMLAMETVGRVAQLCGSAVPVNQLAGELAARHIAASRAAIAKAGLDGLEERAKIWNDDTLAAAAIEEDIKFLAAAIEQGVKS